MTQPGETDRMTALGHLLAIEEHAGPGLVDAVLGNSTALPRAHLEHYADAGAEAVAVDRAAIEARRVEVAERDLLAGGDLIRHDPAKLGRAVLEIAGAAVRARS
jgi:2-phospho-L-lactate transferase/gluconeogenesis factor (CofD/UPF0052 family)